MVQTLNKTFPIYTGEGAPFHNLVLRKATVESAVMSLEDKISGDVMYKDNSLAVTMQEYVVHNGVKYSLVSPPTVVREGLVKDNSSTNGATKYSFEFYHPMYILGNIPFTDVAVSSDEAQYKSQDKKFSWIGYLPDFVAKLNKNLQNTEWVVVINEVGIPDEKLKLLSEVLTFEDQFISDALSRGYETWEVPFVIDSLHENEYVDIYGNDYYKQGKRFVILFGMPTNEIWAIDDNGNETDKPFVFQFGKGVGLTNNSRTPRKNKIVTRIVGSGSTDNIPYGYPQIVWEGNPSWDYTLNNKSGMQETECGYKYSELLHNPNLSSPSYWSINSASGSNIGVTLSIANNIARVTATKVGSGKTHAILGFCNSVFQSGHRYLLSYYCKTERTHRMSGSIGGNSSIGNIEVQAGDWTRVSAITSYMTSGTNANVFLMPTTDMVIGETIQYKSVVCIDLSVLSLAYPAPTTAEEVLDLLKPYNDDGSVKEGSVVGTFRAMAMSYPIYDGIVNGKSVRLIKHPFTRDRLMPSIYIDTVNAKVNPLADFFDPNIDIIDYYDAISDDVYTYTNEIDPTAPSVEIHQFDDIKPELEDSDGGVKTNTILDAQPVNNAAEVVPNWDDTMDDNGEYLQSYFQITLPKLDFDLYACAAITQEMSINMRSGACIGCTFNVQVDWDDYKKNFFDADGNYSPETERDFKKYPDSSKESISIILQKDLQTFGTLMPNIYQIPKKGDEFVVLGISLPLSYIRNAERRLDEAMKDFMLENNIHYFDYPAKVSEHFLATNPKIAEQIRNNAVFRFKYYDEELSLYIKQISIKYGQSPLPQYSITLTDNIEVSLNAIAQVEANLGKTIGAYMTEKGTTSKKTAYTELLNLINTKLSRKDADTAQKLITFIDGFNFGRNAECYIDGYARAILDTINANSITSPIMQSRTFNSGDTYNGGKGFGAFENEGESYAEIDNLLVRNKAVFNELEIRKLSAVGGNVVLSAASSKIVYVKYIPASTGTPPPSSSTTTQTTTETPPPPVNYDRYYCYLKSDDGTMATTNNWQKGDIVRCQTFNVQAGVYNNVSNKNYGFVVIETGEDKLGQYILLQTTAMMTDGAVGFPAADDVIVQMGNTTDADRQNIIILQTADDTPSIRLYKGVSTYYLEDFLVAKISATETIFKTENFKVTSDFTTSEQIVADRGEYDPNKTYRYYDRVSYNGSLWLCINSKGNVDNFNNKVAPSEGAPAYWLLQVARGDTGATGGAINAYFTPNTVVVPASQDGIVDEAWEITIPFFVFSGTDEITSQYHIESVVGDDFFSYSSSGNRIRFHAFRGGGTASVYINTASGDSSTLLQMNVVFSVLAGGGDAYSVGADRANFVYTLNVNDPRPTPITAYLYMLRGSTYYTSAAVWDIIQTENCVVQKQEIESGKLPVRVSSLDSDTASFTMRATIGSIAFHQTISFNIVRNGQAPNLDIVDGKWEVNGEDTGEYAGAYISQLDKYAITIPLNYNERREQDIANTITIKPQLWWSASNIELTKSDIEIDTNNNVKFVVKQDSAENGGVIVELESINFQGSPAIGGAITITIKSDKYYEWSYKHYVTYDILALSTEQDSNSWSIKGYKVDNDGVKEILAKFALDGNNKGGYDAKIKADSIDLQGYTTINGDTKVDTNGFLYARKAFFEECHIDGFVSGGITAYYDENQIGVIPHYVIKDKLNIVLAKSARIFLPNDPEYVGARALIIIQGMNAANTDGEFRRIANQFVQVYTGRTYVKHLYCRTNTDKDSTTEDVLTNRLDQTAYTPKETFVNDTWFFGGTPKDVSTQESTIYRMPRGIKVGYGVVELVGMASTQSAYISKYQYEINDDGTIILDAQGQPTKKIVNGSPVLDPDYNPDAMEPRPFTKWAVVRVEGETVEYTHDNNLISF